MPTISVPGTELFYVEQGAGFPVVLIHGLAGDHTAWLPQLPMLASKYRVIAFDNRGAGQSTQRDEEITTEQLAQDTLALMDELSVKRAHIIGRSMGGAIAQHMALIAPERVQSLALCASFARLDPLGFRVLTNMREVLEWTGSWRDHAHHSVQNFVSAEFFNEHQDTVAAIENLIGGETRMQACYIRQNHACLEHDTLDALDSIRCPTLILGGGRDPICSPTATAWLGKIPGSETVLFESSSHFFLMEESDRFNRLIQDWLERQTPS